MANLYGAYRGAGKAGGAYASSLQDVMNIGYEQEHSKQMFDIGQEESSSKFAAGQQVLGLASTIAGGMETQKEAAADITKALPGADQTYGEHKFGDLFRSDEAAGRSKGETRWSELGEKLSVLFGGKERKWNVPGGIKGVSAGVYKQSDLLGKAKQSTWDELGMDSDKSTVDDDEDDKNVYGPQGKKCPTGKYMNYLTGKCE